MASILSTEQGSGQSTTAAVVQASNTITDASPVEYASESVALTAQVLAENSSTHAADEALVRLILNGVDLHSSNSAPIYVMNSEKAIILLADGTENTLTDSESYTFASDEVDEPIAAIFSKSDLTISGSGSLAVNRNYQDSITSKDGLIIAGGIITVQAADDGLRGKDYLVVEGGSLLVNALGDGLKSDNEADTTQGYIAIAAGTLQVTAGGDAITAQTDVTITGGEFTLSSGGESNNRAAETTSAKGIKGTICVNSPGSSLTRILKRV